MEHFSHDFTALFFRSRGQDLVQQDQASPLKLPGQFPYLDQFLLQLSMLRLLVLHATEQAPDIGYRCRLKGPGWNIKPKLIHDLGRTQ